MLEIINYYLSNDIKYIKYRNKEIILANKLFKMGFLLGPYALFMLGKLFPNTKR